MTIHQINSDADWDTLLKSNMYVMADFYADWCPPCKAIAPLYASLAEKHSLPAFFAFAKINVDHVGSIAGRYGVSAMPTFLFFKEGQQVAVNGEKMIRGANPQTLGEAAEKLGGLAVEKSEAKKAES